MSKFLEHVLYVGIGLCATTAIVCYALAFAISR